MPLRYRADRIVIRCPNWVGDLVASTGALRCLRRNYDGSHVALLVKPSLLPVVEHAPWFDEIIAWDRHESSPEARRAARRTLRAGRFDLAVLFTHSFSSRWFVWRAGVPRRVGLVPGRAALLVTDGVNIDALRGGQRFISKVRLYRALCERLGCEGAEDQRPELFVNETLRARAAELLSRAGAGRGRPLLALVPGASYGPSKRWPPDRFAAVGDRFVRELGFDAAIFTGPGEESVADAVAGSMKTKALRFPREAVDLSVLKALVERCALMVCNDTGPRHYAVAFGVPVVTLMGPTDPRVTESPYERGVVLRQSVPCAPCCRRRCPKDLLCLTTIAPEQVFEAAVRLLGAGPARASAPRRPE